MEEENQTAPSAEASVSEPMSFDSALSILNQADEAPVEENTAASEAPAGGETDVEAEQAEAPATEQETEAAPEAETEDDFVHGNHRTRLRDGTVTTVGELKKLADEAKELKAKLPTLEAREREFEQKAQAIAAQEQLFTQTINQAKAVLQANFPPKPDIEAYNRGEIDIITYTEQKARWDNAVEKWQTLNRAEQAKAQQAEREKAELAKKQEDEFKQVKAQEFERLTEFVPELKTQEGFKAFREDILTHAPKEYGFSAEEIGNWVDHRSLRVLKDAIAYRKLQAEKAKVAEKVKNVPPVQVQAPGRRVSPAEKQAQEVKTGFERLRKTASFNDALAILNQHDL